MKPKSSNTILPKMLNQDYSQLELSQAMATDVRNMRFRTIDNKADDLAWVNEKGTKEVTIYNINKTQDFHLLQSNIEDYITTDITNDTSAVIGKQNIGNYTVVFKKSDQPFGDSIHTLFYYNDQLYDYQNFKGDLNFSYEHLIDSIEVIEDANTYKVYWTDGLNSPRMIDLNRYYADDMTTVNTDIFDFKKEITSDTDNNPCTIDVLKQSQGGSWTACLVGYAVTAFNYQGSESSILQYSDLFFTNIENRALKPEEVTTCSFRIFITISDLIKSKFEYLRVYRMVKRFPDAGWEVYQLNDISISDGNEYEITDAGGDAMAVSVNKILYNKTQQFTAECIGLKDNTLFLGNIKTRFDYQAIKDILNEDGAYTITQSYRVIECDTDEGLDDKIEVLQTNGVDNKDDSLLILHNENEALFNCLLKIE